MCHLVLFLPVLALPVFWLFPFSIAMPIYLVISSISLVLYFLIFRAMRMKPQVGLEAMLGQTGVVIKEIAPEGKIEYAAEIWNATTYGKKIPVGDQVIIDGFWGLNLLVKEVSDEKQ
jgi:membrane protein implicated in regulation of membrane protease activity